MYVWIRVLIWVLLFGLNESQSVAAFEDPYGREEYGIFATSESFLHNDESENQPENRTLYLQEPKLEKPKKEIGLLRRIKRFFKTRKKTDDVPSIEEARKALQGREEYETERLKRLKQQLVSQPLFVSKKNPSCIGQLSIYPENYDIDMVKECILSFFLAKNSCNSLNFLYYADRLSFFIKSIERGSDPDKDEKVRTIKALKDNLEPLCTWIQGLKALTSFFNKEDLIRAIGILYQE